MDRKKEKETSQKITEEAELDNSQKKKKRKSSNSETSSDWKPFELPSTKKYARPIKYKVDMHIINDPMNPPQFPVKPPKKFEPIEFKKRPERKRMGYAYFGFDNKDPDKIRIEIGKDYEIIDRKEPGMEKAYRIFKEAIKKQRKGLEAYAVCHQTILAVEVSVSECLKLKEKAGLIGGWKSEVDS